MKGLTTRGVRGGRPRLERASAGGAERPGYPELHFRAMPPTEALVALAREQDALCRAVLNLDPLVSRVAIERQGSERGATHEVLVRALSRGVERCGRAQHADAATAVRRAYTELLRPSALAPPCPCRAAA